MELTLQINAPEVERALEAKAQRAGVSIVQYVSALIARDAVSIGADEISALYADSLATGGDLTAASNQQEDLHEYSADELAAMAAGEFERPAQRRAA